MGFFNDLKGLFGAGAFDVGGVRFINYITAGSPRAVSFVASWAVMLAELITDGADDEICMGVLVEPAQMTGLTRVQPPPSDESNADSALKIRFQHQLSEVLERRRAHLLDLEFKSLPAIAVPGYGAGANARAANPRLAK